MWGGGKAQTINAIKHSIAFYVFEIGHWFCQHQASIESIMFQYVSYLILDVILERQFDPSDDTTRLSGRRVLPHSMHENWVESTMAEVTKPD